MTYALPSLDRLQAHASLLATETAQPPHPGSVPSHIAGQRCGWAVPAAVEALCHQGLAEVTNDGLHIGRELASHSHALNQHCAAVAQALREAGCLLGWRNETLDIYSETPDTPPLGVIERTATRPLGLRTLAVHLSAWTPDGRIWLARRSLTKNTDPGMWDTLVGGLASSGEDLDLALLRESDEEAGLAPADLIQRTPIRTIMRVLHRLPEGYQVEDVLVSRCVLAAQTTPQNRDGEVMEIRALAPLEVMDLMEAGQVTREARIVLADDMRLTAAGQG